ncbi:MAG: DUF1501 domain-containing protein [Pseudomonadota bacterium]
MLNRRRLLMASGSAATLSLAWPKGALAQGRDPRFVLLVLRGGLDGLALVPAPGDRAYTAARGALADPLPDDRDGMLELDGFFALHGACRELHKAYGRGELAVVHAVAPPYAGRSHFAGQDVLEAGYPQPSANSEGWLYRALTVRPPASPGEQAVSLSGSIPLVLRGARPVSSWSPDRLPEPAEDTMARVLALYAEDAELGPRLDSIMATEDMLGAAAAMNGRGNALRVSVDAAVDFLTHPEGPRVAVLEAGGWDTHANQQGQLANRLANLDAMLARLQTGLGSVWAETVVVVATEFGRTVAMNGTRGTDHGVGGAALVLGGAVNGGQVIADWPGLEQRALFEGRDLRPTTDLRRVFATVLSDHLGLSEADLVERVFPEVVLPQMSGLLKS